MLVNAKAVLVPARKRKYAVPAFNVNNLEFLQSVIRAAVKMKSPVIVQTTEGAVEYAGFDYLVAMIRIAAKQKIPIVMHLDHGKNLKVIKEAIDSGYTSVMFDGSSLPYEENVRKTKTVVSWARPKRVSVEAEIGALAGIEDLVSVEEKDAKLTDPAEAARFAKVTGCDSLAVAIGTSHGAFKFKDKTHLDIERLKRIAKLVKLPIVLHGASGVREDLKKLAERHGAKLGSARGVLDSDITRAIKNGVAKINIDTDLRIAFTAGIHESTDELPSVIDPRKLLERSNLLIQEVAERKMKLFGSAGRA